MSDEIDAHIALQRLGFERHGQSFQRAWGPTGDNINIITISKLQEGWSLVWQRGVGYTIAERYASTLIGIIDALWDTIFSRSEQYLELLKAHAKLVTAS